MAACGICQGLLCKTCAQFLEKNSFAYWHAAPAELHHKYYCGPCYNEKVGPALDNYLATLAKAKGVFVFMKFKSEETRHYKRVEKPLQVEGRTDEKETLLRLAYVATLAGFNGLIDVSIVASKVRNEGYQTKHWVATGTPTQVDAAKLDAEDQVERLGGRMKK